MKIITAPEDRSLPPEIRLPLYSWVADLTLSREEMRYPSEEVIQTTIYEIELEEGGIWVRYWDPSMFTSTFVRELDFYRKEDFVSLPEPPLWASHLILLDPKDSVRKNVPSEKLDIFPS